MKAIVLTAGIGGRMRPLTNEQHKSLLPIGNTTILGRIIEGLRGIGVHEVIVVTGYRADDIRTFLDNTYSDIAFTFVHNSKYRETNNIVSLSMAFDSMEIDSDVILIECDVLFEPRMLTQLLTSEPGTIALLDRYRPGMDGTVVSVDHGFITQVFPPHLQGEDFDYKDKFKTVNIYRFDQEFCNKRFRPLLSCYANVIDSHCYYELVLGMLINMQSERVRAEIVSQSEWAEVDDPNDLAAARFTFEPESRYEILSNTFGGYWNFDILDFAFMRNAYFPSDAVMAAMRRALPDLVRSYGSTQAVLNEKLAYTLECRPERLQCLHGASQVFPLLPQLYQDCPALIPSPTFGEFSRWLPNHATYADSVGIDCGALKKRIADFPLVVFVNPNNPTGTTVSTAWLHSVAAANPNTKFLVDESFISFSGETPLVDRLEREPLQNVLVMASLSKSFGIPGLRLGFVYSCDSELIQKIQASVPIWNLGSLTEFFLELVLKFRPEFADSVSRTMTDRRDFSQQLADSTLVQTVYPSGGNFLLVRLAGDNAAHAHNLAEGLMQQHKIFVKDISNKFGDQPHLRVAVRRPAENRRLVEALLSVAKAAKQHA